MQSEEKGRALMRIVSCFKENSEGTSVTSRTVLPRANRRRVAHHLFESWPLVVRAIHHAKHLALFLDFDGTLVPLRRRPSDVKPLDIPLRRVLRGMSKHRRITVSVISGRPLAELKKLVPVPGVRLLGLHGWEGRAVPPLDEERQLVRQAKRTLDHRLAGIPGIWVEDKGLGLAVHYRDASPITVRRARRIIDEVVGDVGPQIHMMEGSKVWELLPRQIEGKGSATTFLLSKLPSETLPIFVGDDATDESAFQVLRHGLTIHVGNGHRTRAHFLLRNPEEVEIFLLKLEAEIA